MGGKEGSRGYLYQAIISVLTSLTDDDWEKVQIEPDTNNEKIDILWDFPSNVKKAVQVKSSINNFTLPQIIKLLKKMTSDLTNASEYHLVIIGNCSDPTQKIINKINSRKYSGFTKELLPYKDKVNIKAQIFDTKLMESGINSAINKFLTLKGHVVNYVTLELITGALVFQFLKFATNGTTVSKEELEKQLLDWVYYNYPELNGKVESPNLKVQFYLSEKLMFSDEINPIRLGLVDSQLMAYKKEVLKKLVDEIQKIHLPCADKPDESYTNWGLFGTGVTWNISSELSQKQKTEITDKVNRILDITLRDSFFNVGNLKQPQVRVVGPFGPVSDQFEGTEQEKAKGRKIKELQNLLSEYEDTEDMFKFLEQYYLVPLVLRNLGKIFDENIKVLIKLPNDVNVLTASSIKIPEPWIIDEFIGVDGYLNVFRHHKDSKVEENNSYTPLSVDFLNHFDTKRKNEQLISRYNRFVESFFNVQVHKDDKEYTILEYYFDGLNPKENISFPSYILITAQNNFKIKYEITSKNLTDVCKGELEFVH
jgi:hypothetical protein